ncbi:protein shisa-5-like [Carassius auratus]|uniref:Protein shisa-5 n=1 Tax=Carassius auratus TaxID=7957 RepID=A0A6P6NGP5_CARAU|nr:protein shisa-5-like [Carassius auratus]
MASNILSFLLMSAGLFTTTLGYETCGMLKRDSVVCDFWRSEFCCGTCDERYCCSDPQKKLTIRAQTDCHFKDISHLPKRSPQSDAVSIAVGASIIGLVVISILFLICWVCPRCYLYKRFRNPSPVITTATVVTTQYLPQPSAIIQGSQYLPCQALPNNPPYGGQPIPAGPPPSYQETVGPGYTFPFHDGGQATHLLQSSLPTDYTSPQPAYNPAYTGSVAKTSN